MSKWIEPRKNNEMNKKIRQYIGLAVAVLMYYLIHEGAHLVVALAQGVFITDG